VSTESSVPSAGAGGQETGTARALWILLIGNALIETGVNFFFPILPLFLRSRGGGPVLVGAVVASGVLAKVLLDYPAGALSDRVGRRPLLLLSMAAYALFGPADLRVAERPVPAHRQRVGPDRDRRAGGRPDLGGHAGADRGGEPAGARG
jgi:hypothetical protein